MRGGRRRREERGRGGRRSREKGVEEGGMKSKRKAITLMYYIMLPCVTRCYLERLGSVIASSNGVGCSKDRCACIECCLDARLGDGDSLLFHGLVDGRLVMLVHLVKLIDTAHTLGEGGPERGEGEGEGEGGRYNIKLYRAGLLQGAW